MLETFFNSEYCESFRACILKNICEWLLLKTLMKLRKVKNCWDFDSTLKNRTFQRQYQIQVKMYISLFLFHDWYPLEFVFSYNFSLMWWELIVRNKLQTINIYNRVNIKKIRSSRKENNIRTCSKFWPMKNISPKL